MIAVIGTGRMAPGVAAALATTGAEVVILGRNRDRTRSATEEAGRLASRGSGRISAGSIEPSSLSTVDLVIETISEHLAAKRELLAKIEAGVPETATIATNTSSLRIGELATALQVPERFVGIHFLNPAESTAVVEVIPGPKTSVSTVGLASALGRAMGKQPLLAREDVPGAIWNRIQFAVLRECLHLLEQGVADVETLDAAVSDGLAPRWIAAGPLATADLGGLATFGTIAEQLFPDLGNESAPSPAMTDRAAEGRGFYTWTEESREATVELRRRLLLDVRGRIVERRGIAPEIDDFGPEDRPPS